MQGMAVRTRMKTDNMYAVKFIIAKDIEKVDTTALQGY